MKKMKKLKKQSETKKSGRNCEEISNFQHNLHLDVCLVNWSYMEFRNSFWLVFFCCKINLRELSSLWKITGGDGKHRARDATCSKSCAQWNNDAHNVTFLDLFLTCFWSIMTALKGDFFSLFKGESKVYENWRLKHELESTMGDFWSIWSHLMTFLQGTSYVIFVY